MGIQSLLIKHNRLITDQISHLYHFLANGILFRSDKVENNEKFAEIKALAHFLVASSPDSIPLNCFALGRAHVCAGH